jgi:hypothetical protein
LVSWRLPAPEWAKLSQELGNFLLLLYSIYYKPLLLGPLLIFNTHDS